MSQFTPTSEQERALNGKAPLLALAGAGTGKTTVLTHRIARVIKAGEARPDQILALTFTDKAATEMAERLGKVLGEADLADRAREVTVKTFHSFGEMVIRENLLRLWFDRPPAVLSGATGWQLLASVFDDLNFDAIEITTGQIAGVFNNLLHFFSQCKDHLIGPEDLESYAEGIDLSSLADPTTEYLGARQAVLRDLAAAYRRYEQAKREKNVVDFGDLLYLPVRLFKANPDVRLAYRRRFPFLFVDEYQDTNHVQRLLLLDLLDPQRPEIMVIGDDDQAIYRWRGAVVHNIINFHREPLFAPSQVTLAPITKNRRSFPPILDLAKVVLKDVKNRHAKDIDYHDVNKQGQAIIGSYVAASDLQEGQWIAAKIRELEPEVHKFPDDKKRGYGAFAILCRKRSLFLPIGQALDRAGIPYELIGGTGFYGRWEIRDILSYLMALATPANDLATARILLSKRFRLSSRDLFHLSRWVRQQNGDRGREGAEREGQARFHLLNAVLEHEKVEGLSIGARARLSVLCQELKGYAEDRQQLSLSELMTKVIDTTGYRRELLAQPGFDARVALLNLAKLEDQARQFEEGAEKAELADFVEFVGYAVDSGEEEGEVQPIDEETNTVKVMTVHQAKGLEFPIVFLPGLGARIFPSQPRSEAEKWWELPWELRGDRKYLPLLNLSAVRTDKGLKEALAEQKEAEKALQLDEERRLFYVAVTRAQYHLYLSRAHWYGTTVNPRPSSEFWDLAVDSGHCQNLGEEECAAGNPNLALPGEDETAEAKTPEGQPDLGALLLTGKDLSQEIAALVPSEELGRWQAGRAKVDAHLESLASATPPSGPEIDKPDVSCSSLLHYLSCPRGYRYIYVDRLPTRPSPRANLGREVHRRIEELSRPQPPVAKGPVEEEAPDRDDFEEPRDPIEEMVDRDSAHVSVGEMLDRFRQSPYGRRAATYVELPFQLPLATGTLRGRLDRLDRLAGERWELVDFKSGASDSSLVEHYRQQVALYALALREGWKVPADHLAAHLFFLKDGKNLPFTFDDAELDRVRAEAEEALHRIAQGSFPMTADERLCINCDYNHLCKANP